MFGKIFSDSGAVTLKIDDFYLLMGINSPVIFYFCDLETLCSINNTHNFTVYLDSSACIPALIICEMCCGQSCCRCSFSSMFAELPQYSHLAV